METKICSKCKQGKALSKFSEYWHRNQKKYYFHSLCKKCRVKISKKYKQSKKGRITQEKYLQSKTYKIWRKKYSQLEKVRIYRKKYNSNINIKIINNLRKKIALALKGQNKSKSMKKLLGCNAEYLKFWLECKFQRGMTWQNYGRKGWHIDHIKPCSLFNLTKESEQKKCFNYRNLQPLWALDNIRKSNKYWVQEKVQEEN